MRRVVHAAGIAGGWWLFVLGWQRVLEPGADFSQLRWLVFGAALAVPLLTVSWIAHNRGIYRRKGPRRAVTPAELHYEYDFKGRRVEGDWAALAGAQCVEIALEGREAQIAGGGALSANVGREPALTTKRYRRRETA